jgi:N-acetylglutamate synthase-like GNAT family acetyltransferase
MMLDYLTQRKANINDLSRIIELLIEDDLGKARESSESTISKDYLKAFKLIDADMNQYLMVVEFENNVIGTCHLTIMPSMTFKGSIRMQIEAVRVCESMRGRRIGQWMISQAVDYAKSKDVSIIQLTTNKKSAEAKRFYEKLGFESTHEGMKKIYLMMIKSREILDNYLK